jgi:calcineurin-like phosphoesterase family protein
MSFFYTADLHINHVNIIKYCKRPFFSVEQMNAALVDNWNAVVTDADTVMHAGDLVFASNTAKAASKVETLLHRLHGHIVLIPGSHDQVLMRLSPSPKYEIMSPIIVTTLRGNRIVICHYPMRRWPYSHYGSYHMFGHTHNGLAGEGRSWDIGVDGHEYHPWSEAEVLAKMETLPADFPSAHGEPV